MKSSDAKGLIKKPSKRVIRWGVFFLVVFALLYSTRHLTAKRATQFKDCVAAKYDLRRETNFRFLTGACTALGKDGGQVYVSQLRAFGSTDQHDVDVDHAQ